MVPGDDSDQDKVLELLRQTAPLSQGLTWAGVAGWASGAKREDRSD